MPRAFVLDHTVRRLEDGRLLLGGEPPRLVRLQARAGAELDVLLDRAKHPHDPAAATADGLDSAMAALVRRLVDNALLHPVSVPTETRLDEVSIVVPVRDDPERLRRLLETLVPSRSLCGVDAAPARDKIAKIVVVDDGSSSVAARRIARAAEAAGAHLVRHPRAHGPGAARNSGLRAVATPFVAFVDADVLPEQASADSPCGWLAALLGHFEDPRVAAVSPRVIAGQPPDRVAGGLLAYERRHSPLDFGPTAARVGPGHRVRYVPAATLVARTSTVRGLGGFDPGMRYGEDVDLVWRMVQAGWTVRYCPEARVGHDVRPTLPSVARQRFVYGTSAAPLSRRHPGAVSAYECSSWGLLLVAAMVGGRLCGLPPRGRRGMYAVMGLTFVAPSAQLARKLRTAAVGPSGRLAAELILNSSRGELAGLRQSMRRAWWPFTVALLTLVRRDRGALESVLAFLLLPSAIEGIKESRCGDGSVALWVGLSLLDDLSYGAGVWAGVARERRISPLLPKLKRRSKGSRNRRPRGGRRYCW
jgi:mycofactocin system glycosyltransferase